MSLVTGQIESGGAIIDVFVDVSSQRRRLLKKINAAIPPAVHVRALIDTGANVSGFAPRVFRELQIPPVAKMPVITPTTRADSPFLSDVFDVALSVLANARLIPFHDSKVIEADCWLPGEGIEALIGRDILNQCFFQYVGIERRFTLALQT
jgi:hypothetical protein